MTITYNPDYVPTGLNNKDNEYYKKINNVKIAMNTYNKTEFFGGPSLGPELWAAPFNLGVGWTDNGDGSFTCDGSQVSVTDLIATGKSGVPGTTYKTIFEIVSITGGQMRARVGAVSGSPQTTVDTFEQDITANTTETVRMRGTSTFAGTIRLMSFREIL